MTFRFEQTFRAPVAVIGACLLLAACDDQSSPTSPSGGNRYVLTIVGLFPTPGSTIPVLVGGEPGLAIPRGSGLMSVLVNVTTPPKLSNARLYVYLMGDDRSGAPVCAGNLPDAPTWPPEPSDRTVSYSISGFQVTRVPCDVTRVRAVLFTRYDPHVVGPPRPDEILADTVVPADYRLR